jgi:L-cysteate sulfo-lyase
VAAIETFASREGIFLDEVYTGKAAAGLLAYGRSGRLARDENVLFVHTGGAAQLFE